MPAQVGYHIATINELRGIDSSVRTQGYSRLVGETKSWYMFVSAATDAADNINIVEPLAGTGRWFRAGAFIAPSEIVGLPEVIDDRVGSLLQDSPTVDVEYNDTSNSLTLNVKPDSIGDTEVSSISISSVTSLPTVLSSKSDIGHSHSPASIANLEEYIQDVVASLLQQGTNISLSYNDTANTLSISGTPTPIQIIDETASIGAATSLKFTGNLISSTVSAGVATIDVATPSNEFNVYKDGVLVDNVNELNFTGSGVGDITVDGNRANITLESATVGESAITQQNYTITQSVNFNSSATTSFTCPDALVIQSVTTSHPARIRLYTGSAYAANDLLRSVNTELQGEHGCLLEVVTTPTNLTIDLAPPVVIYKTSTASPIHVTIDNIDTATRSYTVVLKSLIW